LRKTIDRTGEVNYNKYGSKIEIIKYTNATDIVIKFDNGYITISRYGDFKKGKPKSPYCKSVYGIGYIGEGKYKTITDDYKHTTTYKCWNGMIERCYNLVTQEKHPNYKGCTVCEEWLNFQTFAKWFEENFYTIDDERMNIDKDILVKGNKVYSPETCIFVSQRINKLFIRQDNIRGEYPIGVCYDKENNKFTSDCCTLEKHCKIGRFDTANESFEVYKEYKENYIKEVAEECKNIIPQKLYIAMCEWKVEITD
jgi:hypothetical protein